MKFADKAILGGAFLTGIIGVLAYKGKLKWPDPRKPPPSGSTHAPVHPSQTASKQAETPAYGQAGYVPQTATDAQGSYDPNAPAEPPAAGGGGTAAVDPSQVYAVGEGAPASGGYTADVGD